MLANHGVRAAIVDPDWNNFAPRVGFAYRPAFAKNTVIRGGFGIYYATDNWNELQFEVMGPPFYQSQTLTSDPTKPTLQMSDMLPSLTASPNLNPFTFDRRNRTPYLSQWSFGVQHTFKRDYLVEVEYVGSTGQKQAERRNLNSAAFDPSGTIALAARRPYPLFGNILLAYHGGWSSYNAMNTRFEKRFSGGLYFLTSYTWQKSLDLGSTDEFSAVGSSFKTLDKGHSSFDVPHRLVFSYVWELPFGKGKRFGGGGSDAGQGGWRLAVFRNQQLLQGAVPDAQRGSGLAEYRQLQLVAAKHCRRLHGGPKLSGRVCEPDGFRLSAQCGRAARFTFQEMPRGTASSNRGSTTGILA